MKVDWSQIIAILIPLLEKHLPKIIDALVNAITRWLENASPEQIAAVGKELSILLKAAKSESA